MGKIHGLFRRMYAMALPQRRWVQLLSAEAPTLAFHASITNPFGKGALIQLLRQLGTLHSDKRQITVGFIGYPNVGKSSIINTLKKKRVCKAAPIPGMASVHTFIHLNCQTLDICMFRSLRCQENHSGETKVWQYITLFRRIFLVDCPGVVYDVGDDDTNTVLKGVVRHREVW
jgi:nuclear GTP-binding protein